MVHWVPFAIGGVGKATERHFDNIMLVVRVPNVAAIINPSCGINESWILPKRNIPQNLAVSARTRAIPIDSAIAISISPLKFATDSKPGLVYARAIHAVRTPPADSKHCRLALAAGL